MPGFSMPYYVPGSPDRSCLGRKFVTLYLFFEMMIFFQRSPGIPFQEEGSASCRNGIFPSMLGASIALGGYFFFRQYACGTDFKAGGVLTEAAEEPGQAADSSSGCFLYGGRIFL